MRNALRSIVPAATLVAAFAATAAADTPFTVKIENVSTATTLRSADGMTAPAPNSPGLWVVHTLPARLFQSGRLQMGWGLEAQAEDGNPAVLAEHCRHHEGVLSSGVFDTPMGEDKAGPALPGLAYTFTFMAKPGDRLSFATMFGQSNDAFYAPDEKGIALFKNGRPVAGDITAQVGLWDAGTEVNEAPGFGPNQAPRQKAPNTGTSEKKPVSRVKNGFPKVSDAIKVTITPGLTASN